ncbi:hypothetical protein M0657_011554 [Pyricularia oryzae]|nr:hypothetical protein M0657_011554 [Pyricularia oryzae]
MGNAGTDAGRDGNDEKMIDGSSLVACPLEAAFSSTHPSLATAHRPVNGSQLQKYRWLGSNNEDQEFPL